MDQNTLINEVAGAACACWNHYAKTPLTVEFFKEILADKLPDFEHSECHKQYQKYYAEQLDNENKN